MKTKTIFTPSQTFYVTEDKLQSTKDYFRSLGFSEIPFGKEMTIGFKEFAVK